MSNHFDTSSKNYDQVFTFSNIGRAQRQQVYNYLSKHLTTEPLRVLELNCGTGEDAHYISNQGHDVIATDISKGMIDVAKSKYPSIHFERLDITKITSETFSKPFDLIFSNFGGLNCLSKAQLSSFIKISKHILTPKGKAILVIMPKHCLWERFYFLLKGKPNKSKRRNSDTSIDVQVEGIAVPTWYYNPKEIVTLAEPDMGTLEIRPIGFTIPPSYMENYFSKRKWVLKALVYMEKRFHSSSLAKYADHYLIAFQKR